MTLRVLSFVIFASAVATGLAILPAGTAIDITAAHSISPSPTPPPEDDVIKIETELVNVLFSAQDRDRRLLTDIKKEDIQILEDGVVQEIAEYGQQVDLPLSLAILVDTSARAPRRFQVAIRPFRAQPQFGMRFGSHQMRFSVPHPKGQDVQSSFFPMESTHMDRRNWTTQFAQRKKVRQ